MTYSPIEFKYLKARADRESLREFIGKEAGPDPERQLDLIRHLAPSILIADGYDFNELRELYAPLGLCCEHVSSDWSGDHHDDSLRCIAVRPFKPGGYDSHPYEFVKRLAGHLRDLLVRAESIPDFGNIIRHAYIEPENMDRWKEGAERWRALNGQADTRAAVTPAASSENRKKGWQDVALPYVAEVQRKGRYDTAKKLYDALWSSASDTDSPFAARPNKELVLRKTNKPIDLKTFQNGWPAIKRAASDG